MGGSCKYDSEISSFVKGRQMGTEIILSSEKAICYVKS